MRFFYDPRSYLLAASPMSEVENGISTFSFRNLHFSSMSTVIEVDDVWKKYRLGIIGTGTLRHDFERWWHRVRGKPDPHSKVGAAPSAKGAGAKVASPDLTPSNLTPLTELKATSATTRCGRCGSFL